MIEIIKEGKLKLIKCKKCGCEFGYEKKDIQQRFGRWETEPFGDVQCIEEYLICPQCQTCCII